MKKITSTSTRLFQYAASAAAFLSVNQVNATVVYTDLDPDQAIGGEGAEFTIDVNEDGTDDFNFMIYSFSGTGTYYGISFTYGVKVGIAEALNGNEFLGSLFSTYYGGSAVYTPVLPSGEGINSEDSFAAGAGSMGISVAISVLGFPYYSYNTGNWLNVNEGYMGFRLTVDKDHFYGWMRLSMSDDASMITIHDYAYENAANQPIFTGQVATAIETAAIEDAQIFSSGKQITVKLPENAGVAGVQVFDLSGKMVKSAEQISGLTLISCSDLASGNYLVKVTGEQGSVSNQVHLSN